jgi:hypothetical protein
MAPPRTGATPILVRILPRLMCDLDRWIEAQPGPRSGRPEAIRYLLGERLAGQPAPASAAPRGSMEGDIDLGELRRWLITFAGKVDRVVAYARRVEAERDALAARAPRLEVVPRPGEQPAVRQPPRESPAAERWPRSPPHSPPRDGLLSAPASLSRGSNPRDDPEAVARARAQLAAAEAAAEARRLQEIAAPRE